MYFVSTENVPTRDRPTARRRPGDRPRVEEVSMRGERKNFREKLSGKTVARSRPHTRARERMRLKTRARVVRTLCVVVLVLALASRASASVDATIDDDDDDDDVPVWVPTFFDARGMTVRALDASAHNALHRICLLYTSPSPRDRQKSRMPSSA